MTESAYIAALDALEALYDVQRWPQGDVDTVKLALAMKKAASILGDAGRLKSDITKKKEKVAGYKPEEWRKGL